jgi:hypothetical protein
MLYTLEILLSDLSNDVFHQGFDLLASDAKFIDPIQPKLNL